MIEFLHEPFFWRALIGACSVALVAGILGSFIVWRRLAFFGDTLAHSGILGIVLAILFELPVYLSLGMIGACIGLLLLKLQNRMQYANDTLLGILSHSTLAIGLVLLGFLNNSNINVLGLLYGDILLLNWNDVATIVIACICVITIMTIIYKPLLRITVHKALAKVEGVPVAWIELIFILVLALSIAFAIKIVGVLLVTALLIIPAASARCMSRGPLQMIMLASLFGVIAVFLGIFASFQYDTPTGPSIVVAALLIFLLNLFVSHLLQSK